LTREYWSGISTKEGGISAEEGIWQMKGKCFGNESKG